jgi:hypothetical protein
MNEVIYVRGASVLSSCADQEYDIFEAHHFGAAIVGLRR